MARMVTKVIGADALRSAFRRVTIWFSTSGYRVYKGLLTFKLYPMQIDSPKYLSGHHSCVLGDFRGLPCEALHLTTEVFDPSGQSMHLSYYARSLRSHPDSSA
jgi:hypothetical protein